MPNENGGMDLIPGERSRVTSTGLPPGVTDDQAIPEAGDDNSVTPEEQSQYDQVVTKAMRWIHKEKSQAVLLRLLGTDQKEIYETVGDATAKLVSSIEAKAQAANVQISPDVLYHAAADVIVPQMFEIGIAAKIFPLKDGSQEEKEQMEMALIEAVRIYGDGMLSRGMDDDLPGQAGDFIAKGVAGEVDSGEVNTDFHRQIGEINPTLRKRVKGMVSGISEPAPELGAIANRRPPNA